MDARRRRPITLPPVRPVAVWVITAALVVVGLLFTYAGTVGLADALTTATRTPSSPRPSPS